MILKLFYKLLLLSLGIFFLITDARPALAQDGATAITNSYDEYRRHDLEEKIFVHTDRSFYLCGQIMWCKVYLVDAADNQPLSLSKVVYMELLNEAHQPMWQGKIAMNDGSGSGSFYIPFTIRSGNYELRAYTRWMKNGSPGNYFRKIITVVNTTRVLPPAVVQDTTYYIAGFFPEGGNLVNGLTSEIAFRVTDNHNREEDCKGIVADDHGDTVLSFNSFRSGRGHFFLKPESGRHYTASITLRNGTTIKQALPEAYDQGMVMHLEDKGGRELDISVQSVQPSGNDGDPFVYLVIRNHQQISMALAGRIREGKTSFIIPKDSLGGGVSAITLFNGERQPVCERLYFKPPGEEMRIGGKPEKENYGRREEVTIPVSTTGPDGNPVKADLSIAVYRLSNMPFPDQENIYHYLWLSSDLNGYIASPGYYFNKNNDSVREAVNDLLMTQGWRKFDWNRALHDQKPVFEYVPEYNGHIITGRVLNNQTDKPAAGVLVYLSVAGKRVQLAACRSDSLGLIHFDMKDYYGANQLVLQTNWERDSTYRIEIQSPFSDQFDQGHWPALHLSSQYEEELSALNFRMQVQNAYVGGQMQQFAPANIDTLAFYGHPYKTYLLDDYTRFTTMEEVLREYVAEVAVRKRKGRYHFMTFNAPGFDLQKVQETEIMFGNDPLVLLDGIPVFNLDKIIAYDPLKVKKLEVVAERYHYGPISTDGILSYTTYKGNLDGFTIDPRSLVIDDEGLQQQRIFFSPDYSTESAKTSRLPDFRELLYWNAAVKTNEKGEAAISFYTGDLPGAYRVVIQGITKQGAAGGTSYSFIVTKPAGM